MPIDIVVPEMGESISEGTVAAWLKSKGDAVSEGETLVELETDKVMVEVPAPVGGTLLEILKGQDDTVEVGEVLGRIDTDGVPATDGGASAAAGGAPSAETPTPRPSVQGAAPETAAAEGVRTKASGAVGPAARILAETHGVDLARVTGTGPRGNVTKEDVQAAIGPGGAKAISPPISPPASPPAAKPAPGAPALGPPAGAQRAPGERGKRVKMSRLRARIAERLVEAQHTAAILTTFNEVDMGEVMAVRGRYKEAFREKYGMPIGFMSFFTKACIEALKGFPAVNAELDGDEVVYKHYYDIGVAVGTERGLVVPVVRDADRRSFIEVELEIARLAGLARDNKLTMGDLTGGTFTISNGGIYGSMLSTPIINLPQVAILGMHNIVKRAVVVEDEIKVRPMMYLALSYDHRIIDGREAVQFLLRVKECIEDPARILLEI